MFISILRFVAADFGSELSVSISLRRNCMGFSNFDRYRKFRGSISLISISFGLRATGSFDPCVSVKSSGSLDNLDMKSAARTRISRFRKRCSANCP